MAVLMPLVAAGLWCAAMSAVDGALAWRQSLLFAGLGVACAQLAALARWRALQRRAQAGRGAWRTGLGMAVVTHATFGVLCAALLILVAGGWREAAGSGRVSDILVQMLFFSTASLFPPGLVTFPATALVAQGIAALRRREIAHDAG
jgi:hypothetical protein